MTDESEAALIRAIGAELRLARSRLHFTRSGLVSRLGTDIALSTYGSYEAGTRACSTYNLLVICQALDLSAPELLARAIARVEANLHSMRIDVHQALADTDPQLDPFRAWVRYRSAVENSITLELEWPLIADLAACCEMTGIDLACHLRRYAAANAMRYPARRE